jgi:DNA-binding CsgD family transcriptional regulator
VSRTDVEALTGLLTKLEAAPDEQAFAERVVPGLGSLIRCDGLGFNDIDVAAQTVRWSGEPAALIQAGDSRRDAFERNMHQHPAIAAFASSGDGRARRTSDFISQRQFRRTDIYNDFYAPLELEHHLVAHWVVTGSRFIAISLFRNTGDFTDRDRTLLGLLRPYLKLAHHSAKAHAQAHQLLESIERAHAHTRQAVLLLEQGERVGRMIGRAQLLLDKYFESCSGSELPEQLSRWINALRQQLATAGELPATSNVLVIDGAHGRLFVRYLPPVAAGQPDALLLREQLRDQLQAPTLAGLGLTRREADVLRLLASGVDNERIAAELFISTPTVKKHLEHIYRKLGVGTRTAAVAKVLGTARG